MPQFIPIQQFDNYIDANIIMTRLQSENINCWLKDEQTFTLAPFMSHIGGGITLMVPEPQAKRAAELLEEFRSDQGTPNN